MSQSLMDTNSVPPTVPPQREPAAPKSSTAALSAPVPETKPALPETTRPSVLSPPIQVFVGPDGPYAVMRWLVYIAMGLVVLTVFNTVVAVVYPHRSGSVWWSMVFETGRMLSAVLPGFVMARLEGRPFGDFGLPARGAFGRNFWAGALWGLAALTVFMLVLRLFGAFYFGSVDLHGARVAEFALFYAMFFAITGLFEDFLMRGYSQWVLSRAINFWPAAALLSLIFGAIHLFNPGEDAVGIVAVVAIGFFFCLTLRRTGTLWWAVGFHMSWDWGQSYLYSVPDSGTVLRGHLLNSSLNGPAWLTGGSVGPEGSYLIFALMAALWILFSRAYPEVKYNVAQSGRLGGPSRG